MKLLIIFGVLTTTLLCTSANAFGSKDNWVRGFSQGTTEYLILGEGQSSLYIACNPDKNAFIEYTDKNGNHISSLDSFKRDIDFYAVVDGGESYLISDVSSDSGASNVTAAWEAFKKGKTIVIKPETRSSAPFILKAASFTLKNAKQILPEFTQSDCHVGM